MKDVLYHIVSSIVDEPKEVTIECDELDGIVNFTISVAQQDMGKIIGKEGKVIKAIRNVMKIPAVKQGKKINITIVEITQ